MNENSSMRTSSVPSISPNGSYCEYSSSCTYLLILKQYLKRQYFFSFQQDFIKKNLSICPLPLTRSPHTHGQLCIYVLFHKYLRRAFGACEVKKKPQQWAVVNGGGTSIPKIKYIIIFLEKSTSDAILENINVWHWKYPCQCALAKFSYNTVTTRQSNSAALFHMCCL